MKNIIDIYDDVSVTAGPGNTLGLGNPMAPTDTEAGSEPLTPCKKKECKGKKKAKKIIEASILGDIEDTIQAGDDIVEFAQWFLEATIEGFSLTDGAKLKIDFDDYLPKLVSCVVSPSKGVFILDTFKLFDADCSKICDRMHLTEKALKNMPKGLKTIKIYNFKYGEYVYNREFLCRVNSVNYQLYD